MAKKKTIAQEVESAAVLLQKLVRLKNADDNGYVRCVTCGVTRRWNDGMQGGHFITRVRVATKLDPRNVHPQCSSCNGPRSKTGEVTINYTLFMEDKFGRDFVDNLILDSRKTKKYTRMELEDIKDQFKKEIRFHECRIN